MIFVLFLCILINSFNNSIHAKAEDMNNEKIVLQERFLKAEGKVLKNQAGKGDVVTLRGTNVGGWQVMEAWMCPTNATDQMTTLRILTERFGKEKAEELIKVYEQAWWQEQDFDNSKELGFNVLRLPISYFNLLDEEGKLREDTLAIYDWFVAECEKRAMYVILDLHAAPGSQNGRDHSGDKSGSKLFTDDMAQNLTVRLWEQLAEHFKGNPTIAGYDLLNEPEGSEEERAPWGKVQLPFFNRLYEAIRAIDQDHIIIFNAVWEPTNMPNPSEYGWDNVMYEYHYYCWEGTDNAVTQRSFTESKVANNDRAGFEVPVLIGEFTLFEKLPSWEHALKIYNENGWSWTTWTYKTVGQGSWGIYNSASSTTPKVNIYTDSEETIREKWSKVDTISSFTKNQHLSDLLRTCAEEEASKNEVRKWVQNVDMEETILRAGTDAEVEVVSSRETHPEREDSKVIRLTVSGPEKIPSATTRNVCITPMVRDSVDATGLDYLLFDVFVQQGNRALQVTLVDKNGAVWTEYTSPEAMPVANQWEKIFLDIRKTNIDTSAIIEIRIGVNVSGTYYFDNLYFAGSYAAPLPEESLEFMKSDIGVTGQSTDWVKVSTDNTVQSSTNKVQKNTNKMQGKVNKNYLILASGIISLLFITLITTIIIFLRNKRKRV
jgi:aryl-phospho-beta-D-glucosidase BglC (GH1 family)